MKSLVIGSKGCIGSNLFNYLSITQEVYGIGHYATNEDIKDVISGFKPDYIYNCAGSITHNYEEATLCNVDLPIKIMTYAAEFCKKAKILLIGSSSEYGNCEFADEETEEKPVSFYGITKLQQKCIAKKYSNLYNMDIKIARPSNVYSENASVKTIVGKIFAHDFSKPLNLGNLSAYRDYVHINDVIKALVAINEHGECNSIYNVSSGTEICVRDLAHYILRLRNIDISMIHEDLSSDCGIKSIKVLNKKLLKLGWEPVDSLKIIQECYC